MGQTAESPRGGPLAAEEVERIADRVRHQLIGRLRDFRLEVSGAGVVLRGRAPTYHAKQLAQHAVMGATDLPVLRNEIEVS
jgi:hypothetical protein